MTVRGDPMTDRDRLVEMLTNLRGYDPQQAASVILGNFDLTPKPQPAGPVLAENAKRALAALHGYTGSCAASHVRLCPSCQAAAREVQDGLLTPAEVERRVREWAGQPGYCISAATVDEIIAALTRPTNGGAK